MSHKNEGLLLDFLSILSLRIASYTNPGRIKSKRLWMEKDNRGGKNGKVVKIAEMILEVFSCEVKEFTKKLLEN